jgi:3,4-dihydroxy 2-butanone 4-phosphate synthase/GTP cyclohydrolase II
LTSQDSRAFEPAGVLVEIMNDDGSMARLPQLKKVAEKFDFKLISIKDLIEYRVKRDSLIEEIVSVDMPTKYGHFKLIAFQEKNSANEHLALVKGNWEKDEPGIGSRTFIMLYRRHPGITSL